MTNYWLVGASWGGVDHQDNRFLKEGVWELGWKDGVLFKRAKKMKHGDRIAIKRMKGKNQTGIKVLHLGIIKEVIFEIDRVICRVDWVVTDLDKDIPKSRGCFSAIHGPYNQDSWVQDVFCL